MPFGVVSRVGRGMGVLYRVVIVEGEGAVLGVNVGHPIVTTNQWGLCCVVVWKSFGVVIGVGPGIDVRNGGPRGSMGTGGF